jgi:hypothetical protein
MIRTFRDFKCAATDRNGVERMPILVILCVRFPDSFSNPPDRKRLKAPKQNFEAFIGY